MANLSMSSSRILSFDLKKWLWYLTLPGVAVILLLGILQAGEPAGFSALVGTLLLAATLIPASCVRLGWWKENAYLRYLLKHQRDLGITAGLWFVAHGAASALFFFDRSLPWLPQFREKALQLTWIMVPVMIVILVTSITAVQKSMGNAWKKVHALIWLLPVLAMMHGNLAIAAFEKEDFAPASLVMLVLILLAFWEAIKNKSYSRALWVLLGLACSWLIWWG